VTLLAGEQSFYGPRQNMDITHPTYLFYSERIIRQIIRHYKDHPAVIGYQIDNERDPTARPARMSRQDSWSI